VQTGPLLRYPDFLCIGAQKAGTTWLHTMLEQHPDVWLPPLKELHYFNRVHVKNQHPTGVPPALTPLDKALMESVLKSIQWLANSSIPSQEKLAKISQLTWIGEAKLTNRWYGKIFKDAPASTLCGEIAPAYAPLPDEGIKHILRLQPKAKFILIMRDPIARGWSHLRMDELKGFSGPDRYVRWIANNNTWFEYSDYMTTIERFSHRAPAENILLLYFDDIAKQPEQFLGKVCEFLELDPARAKFKKIKQPVHVGESKAMPADAYAKFRERLKPVYERLLSLDNATVRNWYRQHYS
jgi:hypothetical protein